MKGRKDNISTMFLLPLLGIDKRLKEVFYEQSFINTYLYCDKLHYEFNALYILFQPSQLDDSFNKFIKALEKNPNYINTVDSTDNKVILIYKIPEKYDNDYDLFIKGKYSKLSGSFRKNFDLQKPSYDKYNRIAKDANGQIIYEPTAFFHIFNKTETLREIWKERIGITEISYDLELYDIINEKNETLNLENYIL